MARVVAQRRQVPYVLITFVFLFLIAAIFAVVWRMEADEEAQRRLAAEKRLDKLADSDGLNLPEVVRMIDLFDSPRAGEQRLRVLAQYRDQISQLAQLITGDETPDAGTFRVGETVKLAHVDQGRELDPDKSIWQVISDGQETIDLGKTRVNSRAWVARFNFSGSDQQKKVSQISGGERNRVHLARLLKDGAKVLLLDEPTNDLDVNTLRALEEALENFAGCAVIISHDRWFLDRIATHILAFEGDSEVVWFEGNYSDYEKDRRVRLGNEADQPRRVRYRPMVRD